MPLITWQQACDGLPAVEQMTCVAEWQTSVTRQDAAIGRCTAVAVGHDVRTLELQACAHTCGDPRAASINVEACALLEITRLESEAKIGRLIATSTGVAGTLVMLLIFLAYRSRTKKTQT